jgi:tyrosinase
MPRIRKNVYELGADWADPILWYARGVKAMKAKKLAEPTSWRFYAAIHGLDQPLWKFFGYLKSSETMPSNTLVKRFWKQCQHGSWYFLPWHRGYLLAFEANIQAAVKALGGPNDWALPYWNYFKPNQFKLPPAFASPDWPDGTGNNPLFVPQRHGPNSDGNVFVPVEAVNLDALMESDYTGVASGGSPGFGGVDTGFEHGGQVHGGIESQPHDWVHGLIGGGDPNNPQIPGLMSDPDTAGLDPIFWLHHCNIDRLWEVWRQSDAAHLDPTEGRWINGPGSIGERTFSMPMPGNATLDYTPGDMADLGALDYEYDDLTPAGAAVPPLEGRVLPARPEGMAIVPQEKNVELVGANSGALRIAGSETQTAVQLDSGVRQKVSASLNTALESNAQPDRVFLNLEHVRGLADATALQVYVGDQLAGSIALFGVRKATAPEGEHAGEGLTFVLEITKIVDALHLNNALDVDALNVRIVAVRPVPDEAQISIGRISVFRQGR